MLPCTSFRDFHTREGRLRTCTRTVCTSVPACRAPSCGGTAASSQRQYFTTNVLSSFLLRPFHRIAPGYGFETMIHSMALLSSPPRARTRRGSFRWNYRANKRLHSSVRNIDYRAMPEMFNSRSTKLQIDLVENRARGFPSSRINIYTRRGIVSRVEADLCLFKRASCGRARPAFVPL